MIPQSYEGALKLYQSRKARGSLARGVRLANNTYLTWPDPAADTPEWFAVRLHSTNVVTFHASGETVLDSGGWLTVTTKARMNEAGLRVCSTKGVWYVNGEHPFADGLTTHPDGTVTGEGEDPRATFLADLGPKNFSAARGDLKGCATTAQVVEALEALVGQCANFDDRWHMLEEVSYLAACRTITSAQADKLRAALKGEKS